MPTTFPWTKIQSYLGELTCSFIFGFTVYSSILTINLEKIQGGPILVGLALGFCAIAIIYSFLDLSLAHFNPAITLTTIIFNKLNIVEGIIYIIMQMLGFMVALSFVLLSFPGDNSDLLEILVPKPVNNTVSTGNLMSTEIFLSGILVFVAFAVAINKKKKITYETEVETDLLARVEDSAPDTSLFGPLAIGLTIGFLAFLGNSTSGGAFNPALVFAPVLFHNDWIDSWKYFLAEFIGGFLGGGIQILLNLEFY
ncbi:Aquaporin [Cucumispora dikerogammari]|nr:Aquaporin [Cucumispora dikerogammari]